MAVNRYFQNGSKGEQNLYENLVIEAIQIYGQDVYYIPRKIVKKDLIMNEEVLSKFDETFKIEMYIDSLDGFEGDGKLLERFGLEVRDQVNLVVANARWNTLIGKHGYDYDAAKPLEGDLIYVPLMKSLFEISYVDSRKPFYQLQDLPTFRLTCEKFEYESQEIDTNIDEVDDIQTKLSQGFTFVVDSRDGDFDEDEQLTFTTGSYTGSCEFLTYETSTDSPTIEELRVGTLTFDDGKFHNIINGAVFVGVDSGFECTISEQRSLDDTDSDIFANDLSARNAEFANIVNENDYIDFSEANPFGEPFNF